MSARKIVVEVFVSPFCPRCPRICDVVERLIDDIAADNISWREVNVVDEIDYAVAMGVLSTPSIVIEGRLVFSSAPPEQHLRELLQQYADGQDG